MIETAAEFINRMRDELDKLNSWNIPISINGKSILDVKLVEKRGSIKMEIRTE